MDKTTKNILYIGPYNEESNRGRQALLNIRGLQKAGHKIKIVPIYSQTEISKETPEDLVSLETTKIENYDVCIQHCDPIFYSFNNNVGINIGIYNAENTNPDPIINTRLSLVDKIVVNSQRVYNGLCRSLSSGLSKNIVYCPAHIDLQHVLDYKKEIPDWIDNRLYYFYSELEFTDQYDWEKLIYVYMTTFKNSNSRLIIKTTNLKSESDSIEITNRINKIATTAKINPEGDNLPKVLNGVFDEDTSMSLYNGIDCFIECGRTQEYNPNMFIAAAMQKTIICNSKLAFSEFFDNAYAVNAYKCNALYSSDNDTFSCSLYHYNYTMDPDDLRRAMLTSYSNKDSTKQKNNLEKYDISNIDTLIC